MSPTTRRRALTTLGAAVAGVLGMPTIARAADTVPKKGRPLARAHAHNDYDHTRPLLDALDHRFTSVEADIYLVDGELLVAHDPVDLDPSRTLESLYLDPLARLIRAHHGSVHPGEPVPFQLLIDIKTAGGATYAELDRRLRPYRSYLTSYAHGAVRPAAVTAVVSGDRGARAPMEAQRTRLAFYDGRLTDLGGPAGRSFAPLISDNWSLTFGWAGAGPMPSAQRATLHRLVGTAHANRQRVRFWSTPDLPGPARDAVWTELLAAGVDHINTDDLAGLESWLDAHDRGR
ncbi:phosphatidylinositol-specific phospholipase C/glycerophosphodiester phosphodiesterase family protein [Streptomyces tsukubensis]|uniref:Altered inheritance of mitochondria protein 6 n=1 Tax=Streptomyces tsukubensis TaxID=83656 RepID=A0A1V4AGR6_9ACTN|nr:phosphatidylinositol-specific phospholipase C/glycerophosphodiester phosphodiesterase family protein [Streptomyces tsukubensis]OON82887.1 hypothetical protein B1H18_02410 [Streptomyces tsukubensis]QFR91928.1 hypothetical protein GBW32_01270 [Streptomyces tsukubensis]